VDPSSASRGKDSANYWYSQYVIELHKKEELEHNIEKIKDCCNKLNNEELTSAIGKLARTE